MRLASDRRAERQNHDVDAVIPFPSPPSPTIRTRPSLIAWRTAAKRIPSFKPGEVRACRGPLISSRGLYAAPGVTGEDARRLLPANTHSLREGRLTRYGEFSPGATALATAPVDKMWTVRRVL